MPHGNTTKSPAALPPPCALSLCRNDLTEVAKQSVLRIALGIPALVTFLGVVCHHLCATEDGVDEVCLQAHCHGGYELWVWVWVRRLHHRNQRHHHNRPC